MSVLQNDTVIENITEYGCVKQSNLQDASSEKVTMIRV